VKIRWPERLTRNSEAPWLFEAFFIAAVASFLGIRAFLAAAGYPQVGSNGLHVAHMLWGGLLMLLAILLLLGFLNRTIQQGAAVIAGLGFGTFIDEIGKFVTADNDYFFRPAVALAYVAFVAAFLVARAFVGQGRLTPREASLNTLAALAALPTRRLERDDEVRIGGLLKLADRRDPGTALIEQYLALRTGRREGPSRVRRFLDRLDAAYETLMANPRAVRILTLLVVAYAVAAVIGVGIVAIPGSRAADGLTGSTIAQLGSTVVGASFVFLGAAWLGRSRVAAYHWMLRGILVWILVSQVFVFYTSQLAGLGGLAVDLVAYAALRYALSHEVRQTR